MRQLVADQFKHGDNISHNPVIQEAGTPPVLSFVIEV